MAASCSCLRIISTVVVVANFTVGVWILTYGIIWLQKYLNAEVTIGYIIVAFQLSFFLFYAGATLLWGIIKTEEKLISLYLLIGSLIWFVITNLLVFYMIFKFPLIPVHEPVVNNATLVEAVSSTAPTQLPSGKVPLQDTIGYSIGLILFWCGQLGVYKFHQQVVENNMINTGESYVSSAMNNEEKPLRSA